MTASNPIRIAQIDHVVLRAKNIETMVAFYRDVLGCKLVKHNEPLGLFHLKAGSSMIDLVDMKGKLGLVGGRAPGKDRHNVDHFALRVKEFDNRALRRYLKSHGVNLGETAVRFGAKGDGKSLYFEDPEGNGVEIKGPTSP
jgi:catechol 2,3-dioxygenase-like lactoylglutathione lyase family enzyme